MERRPRANPPNVQRSKIGATSRPVAYDSRCAARSAARWAASAALFERVAQDVQELQVMAALKREEKQAVSVAREDMEPFAMNDYLSATCIRFEVSQKRFDHAHIRPPEVPRDE